MAVASRSDRSDRSERVSVSTTSAQRFAARVRARRRRRLMIVLLVFLVLAGLTWLALKSPWATVRRIEVTGTHRIPLADVRAQATSELGQPMLLARTGAVAAGVRRQPLVRSVQVTRHWPGTLRVSVLERVPVAAVPAGSGLVLVDVDGVQVEHVDDVRGPAGLPRLQVSLAAARAGAVRGCLTVLRALPPALARRLNSIGATTPDGIWLKLTGGARVEWGNESLSARKAEVLLALLPQHAVDYDVRSPDTPAVRQK